VSHILGVVGDAAAESLHAYRQAMLRAMNLDADRAVRLAEAPGGALAQVPSTGPEIPLAGGGLLGPGPRLLGAAEGVLDNRAELGPALAIDPQTLRKTRDCELMHLAFQRWGRDAVHHLRGDYVWAYWDPMRTLLTLGRDHNGNSVLYFSGIPGLLAFSTSHRALAGLSWVSGALDPLSMAATIAHLNPRRGRTVRADIGILPPAHTATWHGRDVRLQRYWFPEETELWRGQSEDTYCEALAAGIQEAAGRMYGRARKPALTLTAGLDSGALAWAWTQTAPPDTDLATYCATPLFDTQTEWPAGFVADELPQAQATAAQLGLEVPVGIAAADRDPLQGVAYMLQANLEPSVGVGNMYWIGALLQSVQREGHDLLMTGQQGNGTISWYGRPWSRSFRDLASRRSLVFAFTRKVVRPCLRWGMASSYHRLSRGLEPWLAHSLLQPDMARQLHIREYVSQTDFHGYYRFVGADARLPRLQVIEPGRHRVGMRWAERGYFHGLRIRDATASKELVELCLSIPDAVWSGPRGADRRLARRAMTGKLPAAATARLVRGRQAADLFQRLQARKNQVSRTLEALASQEEVAAYLNMERACAAWKSLLQQEFTYSHQQRCLTTVMPALGFGLFIAGPDFLAGMG